MMPMLCYVLFRFVLFVSFDVVLFSLMMLFCFVFFVVILFCFRCHFPSLFAVMMDEVRLRTKSEEEQRIICPIELKDEKET